MTRETILALSGRELDAAVAREVCGWRSYRTNQTLIHFVSPKAIGELREVFVDRPFVEVESGGEAHAPPYSTSLDACREAEEVLKRIEVARAYGDILLQMVEGGEMLTRNLAMAPADMRCRALLLAVCEKK